MKRRWIRWLVPLVVVVTVAVVGLSGLYRIDEGEQGLVLTFGEITDVRGPGLYWHVPGVQTVRTQSKSKIYTLEYGFRTERTGNETSGAEYSDVDDESIMLTGDQNIVKVEAVYTVSVGDVAAFLYNVADPFGTMQGAFETVLRRNLQNRTLDDALLNKQDIQSELLPDFRNMLAEYNIGVTVNDVLIQNITVPSEVSAAYEDVNNAMNEKTQKLDEAEKYKNAVVPNARAKAYEMVQEAQAYEAETVASAQGEVAQFNEVYGRYVNSKEITRKRLLIETLENILSQAKQLYIVNGDGNLLQVLGLNDSGVTATAAPTSGSQGGDAK